jgi:hypothetical protein
MEAALKLRGNILPSAASWSADTSLRAAKAITA